MKKFNEMTKEEIELYINETKKSLIFLLDEFTSINNGKIVNNTNITPLLKRAYNIKSISDYVQWSIDKIKINDNISSVKSNTKPKRGEIWTCKLGMNIGSEENKVRPVVIIQNDTGNEKSNTTIIAPISNKIPKIATHKGIKRTDYILENGEDEITGTLFCEQIRVVSKSRLGRHVATFTEDFIRDFLNPKIKTSLELK